MSNKKKLRRFRVLRGSHTEGMGKDRKIYRVGDIVKTTTDLNCMNSAASTKFEEVGADDLPSPADNSVEAPTAS